MGTETWWYRAMSASFAVKSDAQVSGKRGEVNYYLTYMPRIRQSARGFAPCVGVRMCYRSVSALECRRGKVCLCVDAHFFEEIIVSITQGTPFFETGLENVLTSLRRAFGVHAHAKTSIR